MLLTQFEFDCFQCIKHQILILLYLCHFYVNLSAASQFGAQNVFVVVRSKQQALATLFEDFFQMPLCFSFNKYSLTSVLHKTTA